jgi:GGDEF domain-containing protein
VLTLDQERILLIGDHDRTVHAALAQVLPGARVNSVASYFDAIAELSTGAYTSVLAAAEPIERRPESAVRALRDLAPESRLMLFGHPTLEPLSRKMMEFGCDDYLVTPISAPEIQQIFGSAPLRFASPATEPPSSDVTSDEIAPTARRISTLSGLPLADIVLDSILQHPHGGLNAALARINARVAPALQLVHTVPPQPAPQAGEGLQLLSHAIRVDGGADGMLHLLLPRDEDEAAARHALAQLAMLFGKVLALEDRHRRLEYAATHDDLTGLYNGRYFRLMLGVLINRAKLERSTVTLLLFDIDNFKSYNDRYGHGAGDEILRQTAALMRRCSRPHDIVARISGDEFAVVFWEREGPRQPRDPVALQGTVARVPQSVRTVCDRFRKLISSPDFQVLGTTGQGTLTISGGLSVYPFDAQTPEAMIEAADRALMFDAKKSGKNSIFLVGNGEGAPGI